MMSLVTNPVVLQSYIVALLLTGVSYIVGLEFGWISSLNWLEVFAVFTSYSCTYLCVKQSRWNYPLGMLSVAAYSMLFYFGGLYASMVLNVYLLAALVYGWFRWGPDKNTRPVTTLDYKSAWFYAYIGGTFAIYACIVYSMYMLGATLPLADSAILVGTILGQLLLDNKKLENWFVWAVINVLAIPTYAAAGLPLVAFQYVFFLANTIYGYFSWKNTIGNSKLVET